MPAVCWRWASGDDAFLHVPPRAAATTSGWGKMMDGGRMQATFASRRIGAATRRVWHQTGAIRCNHDQAMRTAPLATKRRFVGKLGVR